MHPDCSVSSVFDKHGIANTYFIKYESKCKVTEVMYSGIVKALPEAILCVRDQRVG